MGVYRETHLDSWDAGPDKFINYGDSVQIVIKKKLFIGSLSEELKLAEAAKALLDKDFDVTIWNESVIRLYHFYRLILSGNRINNTSILTLNSFPKFRCGEISFLLFFS